MIVNAASRGWPDIAAPALQHGEASHRFEDLEPRIREDVLPGEPDAALIRIANDVVEDHDVLSERRPGGPIPPQPLE